jgi:hypothetical protein
MAFDLVVCSCPHEPGIAKCGSAGVTYCWNYTAIHVATLLENYHAESAHQVDATSAWMKSFGIDQPARLYSMSWQNLSAY